jgi:hypothetical protein
MKSANLLRYPHPSSLRRTLMYTSLLGISGGLHLDALGQPAQWVLFSELVCRRGPAATDSPGDLLTYAHPEIAFSAFALSSISFQLSANTMKGAGNEPSAEC